MVLFQPACLLTLVLGVSSNAAQPRDGQEKQLADVCIGADDASSSFLQMSSRSTHGRSLALHRVSNTTKIKPVDCTKLTKPIQVYKGDAGFEVAELNVSSGSYSSLYSIPFDSVPGGYKVLNGCGINPIDSILYCAIFAQGSWLVRLDEDNVEFVLRLPQHNWNSGTFGQNGTFFLADPHAGFIVLKDVHKMTGYTDKKDAFMPDMRDKKRIYPPGWHSAADIVVTYADLNNTGVAAYVMVLFGPHLQIAEYDPEADLFTNAWKINVKPHRWDNVFGAGWNFQSKVFFASNRGSGVYQVPMQNVTKTDGAWIELVKIGNSSKVADNDGINCMGAADPWKTDVAAVDCKKYIKPLQILKRDAEGGFYQIAELESSTGKLTEIFRLNLTMTIPTQGMWIKALNGVGISPKDSIMYGVLHFGEWRDLGLPVWRPCPHFLVRFSEGKIEFVARLQTSRHPIAGTFDKGGNYYYFAGGIMYVLPRVDEMKGYTMYNDTDLPQIKYNSGSMLTGLAESEVGDLVAVEGDFDGQGKATWILGVANPDKKLIVVKPNQTFALQPDLEKYFNTFSGDCIGDNRSVIENTNLTACMQACGADSGCAGCSFGENLRCVLKSADCTRDIAPKRTYYEKMPDKVVRIGTSWAIPANYTLETWMKQAFGSAWNFENKAYFASNDGAGTFEVPLEDIVIPPPANSTVSLKLAGYSTSIADTDGMNCMHPDNEFKYGDSADPEVE